MIDWKLPEMLISLVYRRRKLVPAKTRVFLDFIVEDFRENQYAAMWDAALTSPPKKPRLRRRR